METITYFGKTVQFSPTITPEKRARLIAIMREKERNGWRDFLTLEKKDGPCADCATNTFIGNYYMVTKDIWTAYGAGEGLLCIACLQARMGRNLTLADFIDCPVNQKFLINRFDFVR